MSAFRKHISNLGCEIVCFLSSHNASGLTQNCQSLKHHTLATSVFVSGFGCAAEVSLGMHGSFHQQPCVSVLTGNIIWNLGKFGVRLRHFRLFENSLKSSCSFCDVANVIKDCHQRFGCLWCPRDSYSADYCIVAWWQIRLDCIRVIFSFYYHMFSFKNI